MRFLRKSRLNKIVLIISDLHLGAGPFYNGRINFLEDFHFDKELVDFLKYYSQGDYQNLEIELIINGDFLDFLSVPFVEFYDDEYWCEKSSLEKLKIIMEAHPEVILELINFITNKKHKIVYIIGNHDAEMIFESAREYFLETFPEEIRDRFIFYLDDKEYIPIDGVAVKHGHEYENAHQFDLKRSIIKTDVGEKYFVPPWGSYYVTKIINKFKEEKKFINSVRPIKTFIIYGLIFDTLFTLRFIFSTVYFTTMVIFLYYFKQTGRKRFKEILINIASELELFQDYEAFTRDYFYYNPHIKALIVGHTHAPCIKNYPDGTIFINTGTWTKMYNLDIDKSQEGLMLTYAIIEKHADDKKVRRPSDLLTFGLNVWKGTSNLPYDEFN